jgi:hypothetical protein
MVYQCNLRLTARSKSGGPSLGRSPDAQKQRRPVNQDQIQIFGEIGSTQFLEQGFRPCSFFILGSFLERALVALLFLHEGLSVTASVFAAAQALTSLGSRERA